MDADRLCACPVDDLPDTIPHITSDGCVQTDALAAYQRCRLQSAGMLADTVAVRHGAGKASGWQTLRVQDAGQKIRLNEARGCVKTDSLGWQIATGEGRRKVSPASFLKIFCNAVRCIIEMQMWNIIPDKSVKTLKREYQLLLEP